MVVPLSSSDTRKAGVVRRYITFAFAGSRPPLRIPRQNPANISISVLPSRSRSFAVLVFRRDKLCSPPRWRAETASRFSRQSTTLRGFSCLSSPRRSCRPAMPKEVAHGRIYRNSIPFREFCLPFRYGRCRLRRLQLLRRRVAAMHLWCREADSDIAGSER